MRKRREAWGEGPPDSDHKPPLASEWQDQCPSPRGFASALCHARINLERLHHAPGLEAEHNELSPWLSVAVLATTGPRLGGTRPPAHSLGHVLSPST